MLSAGRQCSYDMHPLCQVHNALKTLPDSEEILRADLELRRSLFDAATALQLKKIASADVAQIGKHCNTLLVQGITLPLSHCLEITKRVACVALADGDFLKWQKHISLATSDTSGSSDGGTMAWTVEEPTFGDCLALWQQPRHRREPDAEGQFQEAFLGCCLTDQFLKLVSKASGTAGEIDVAPLLDICGAFLKEWQRCKEESLPAGPKAVVLSVVRVMRGLAALCSPIPAIYGSSLEDVQFIMPRNASSAPILQLPRVGRILVNKLRQQEAVTHTKRGDPPSPALSNIEISSGLALFSCEAL